MSKKIDKALELAMAYGDIDGAHHKMWVIDQMVRVLAENNYDRLITRHNQGNCGPDTYSWDTGISP